MTTTATRTQREYAHAAEDERLVKRCLDGDQEAWSALIDKYKNLIYSIPIRLGMYQDAADIFQAVCVDLLSELPKLREHRALPKWLIQTCYHKCVRQQQAGRRHVSLDPDVTERQPTHEMPPEQMLVQLEREQAVRNAVAATSTRCQRMIQMLFFEVPARTYQEIAEQLGLATGSIGFIRGRCLMRLRKHLEKENF